ncbi:hypothetical protein [Polaromonas sp.]|uniref:hypothetical protein n=1 Tax=Polaromonas sp. TaxID=1869339 RepID=UPI00375372A1
MKSFIRLRTVFAWLVLASTGQALAQASGPSGFAKKKLESVDSVPGLHSGNVTASVPAAAGYPGAWSSCSKQTALIDELEKTVALQTRRIGELEAAVKLASKVGAR